MKNLGFLEIGIIFLIIFVLIKGFNFGEFFQSIF
jgi:hypothetical protein